MYDPFLLGYKSTFSASTLYTDDMLSAMPQSLDDEEAKIPNTFTCLHSQEPRTDIIRIDLP